MLLTEFYLNGIRTKEKPKALSEEQQRKLFEFDISAGFKGDFNTWKESLTYRTDIKANERYRQALTAGTRLSFEEYQEKVFDRE